MAAVPHFAGGGMSRLKISCEIFQCLALLNTTMSFPLSVTGAVFG